MYGYKRKDAFFVTMFLFSFQNFFNHFSSKEVQAG